MQMVPYVEETNCLIVEALGRIQLILTLLLALLQIS